MKRPREVKVDEGIWGGVAAAAQPRVWTVIKLLGWVISSATLQRNRALHILRADITDTAKDGAPTAELSQPGT